MFFFSWDICRIRTSKSYCSETLPWFDPGVSLPGHRGHGFAEAGFTITAASFDQFMIDLWVAEVDLSRDSGGHASFVTVRPGGGWITSLRSVLGDEEQRNCRWVGLPMCHGAVVGVDCCCGGWWNVANIINSCRSPGQITCPLFLIRGAACCIIYLGCVGYFHCWVGSDNLKLICWKFRSVHSVQLHHDLNSLATGVWGYGYLSVIFKQIMVTDVHSYCAAHFLACKIVKHKWHSPQDLKTSDYNSTLMACQV